MRRETVRKRDGRLRLRDPWCRKRISSRKREREVDDCSEIHFWFVLSYISSARGFIHERCEPGDACLLLFINTLWHMDRGLVAMDPGARVQGRFTWTGSVQVFLAARRALEYKLPVNQIRPVEARRVGIDSVPTSMVSPLGNARRGLFAQCSFLLLPLIKFVLGALRPALILCLPGMCFQLPWTCLPGKARRCRSGWPYVWADSHEGCGSSDQFITRGGREKSRIFKRVPGPSLLGERVTSSRGSTPDHRSRESVFLLVWLAG